MKVTDKQYTESMDGSAQAKAAKHKGRAGKANATSPSDMLSGMGESSSAKVKLSERATDMKKVREIVDSQPDVDEAKIAKFKNLINSGQYKVNAEKVADKMVDEHAYGELFRASTED
jgi:negative regulator of flagellin synthesis FlgM